MLRVHVHVHVCVFAVSRRQVERERERVVVFRRSSNQDKFTRLRLKRDDSGGGRWRVKEVIERRES